MQTKTIRHLAHTAYIAGTAMLCAIAHHAQADTPSAPPRSDIPAIQFPPSFVRPLATPTAPAKTRPPGTLVPHVLIDTDFSSSSTPTQPQHGLRAWGNLAVPWRDTSGWGRVWVNYNIRNEGGQRFQRIAVSKLEDGRGQFAYLLPKLYAHTLKLHLKLRGTPGLSLFFGIRQQGFPWNYAWANAIVLTKQWRDLDWPVELPANVPPSLFIFEIPNNGQLDLAACRLEEPTPSAME